ncbi:hypothetical protein AURDEDRAFT_109681 [Auricularia subglabra TFB-10046 SS5]|nr:hypothetical protein AURDEDRAFT_109681 [Auricularia subglabra TFB-10046 SS5]
MSASSPQPLEGMANPEPEPLYTNGGLTNDGAGDVRLPEDVEGNGALGDELNHAGAHDGQSTGDMGPPTGDGRDGSPSKNMAYRDPLPKPNKVYIGNLPEQTRESDLQSCFGKIGRIASIELKFGYGFVEFETQEAAEESVAKYHEGWFMGNKIKVEISRGRNKGKGDQPGACFKCGQMGHWARECPHGGGTNGVSHHNGVGHSRPANSYRPDPLTDRMPNGARDYAAGPPPPTRDYPPGNREGYGPDRYATGGRYGYDYHGPPRDAPPRDARDYYPPGAPPVRPPPAPPRPAREFDDYSGRRDYRAPPPGPPAPYEARPYYPEYDRDPGYPRPPYNGPPPARDGYDRGFDRRGPPPADRYGPPPPVQRPRTPPGPPPPRGRDGYPAPRDYAPMPPAADYRRPPSPGPGPRHGFDFGGAPRQDNRGYRPPRGRSQSPGPRGAAAAGYRNYGNDGPAPGFGPPADRGPYGAPYAGNGYTAGPPMGGGMPPMAGHARPMGRGDRDRDYAPRTADRGGDAAGYSRRP